MLKITKIAQGRPLGHPDSQENMDWERDQMNDNPTLLDQFNQRLSGFGMHIAKNEYEPGYVVNIPETTIQLTEEEINLLNTMMEQLKMEVQPEQQNIPETDPNQGFGFTEGLNDGMG